MGLQLHAFLPKQGFGFGFVHQTALNSTLIRQMPTNQTRKCKKTNPQTQIQTLRTDKTSQKPPQTKKNEQSKQHLTT